MDILRWLSQLFGTNKLPSPSNIVPDSQISYDDAGKLTIDLSKLNIPFTKLPKVWYPGASSVSWSSMEPVFSKDNNWLLIQGADAADQKALVDFIKVGDIAVYRIPADLSQASVWYAVHRIVKIGKDDSRYFVFKGDNTALNDPYKARDENILWLAIGTIY